MNSIKLFVDDYRSAPDDWHLAKTITEAVRILLGPIYCECVSLDHDIIFRPGKHSFSEETFATVAHFISLLPKERLPKIVYVHTANPRGAGDIEDILRGIVPTQRVGDSVSFDMSLPSTYKEDLSKFEAAREKEKTHE